MSRIDEQTPAAHPPDQTPLLPARLDDETNSWARAGDEGPVNVDPDSGPAVAADLRRYRFGAIIATGGMGVVHRVRDMELGRDLAIKTIHERLGDRADVRRRFVEEARITGQLQHPGVPPAHELGRFADGRPFLAMKLIRGRTLSELLRERATPAQDLDRFLTIFEQVAQTVAYAHSKRVIHRDLKPGNVMVGPFGEVQVMDWGCAKVLGPAAEAAGDATGLAADSISVSTERGESDSQATPAHTVLGTPAYMAPEQARGEIGRIDERADVFGLGAVLFAVLVGRAPFPGGSHEEVRARAMRGDLGPAFQDLDACAADTELIGLARRCLAPERDDRPRDASEVSQAIAAHREGVRRRLRDAELARAEARAREAEARKRRHWQVWLAASLVALIALGATALAWAQFRLARADALLHRATDLCDQAERDPRGSDPRDARAALDQAVEALAGLPGGQRALEVAALEARVERLAGVRALVDRLAFIRTDRGEHLDRARADRDYAEAFRTFGLQPDALGPEAVGRTLAPLASAAEIAAGIDDWAWVRRLDANKKDDPSWRRLVEAARAVDRDPWRDELRRLVLLPPEEGRSALLALAADEAALAGQSAMGLDRLARALKDAGEADAAARVYRAAWDRFPADFWINHGLALSSRREAPETGFARPDEAVRFLTAAIALSPRGQPDGPLVDLALALADRKDFDEAVAVTRRVIRAGADPVKFGINLATILYRAGRRAEAFAEYRKVLQRDPDNAVVHFLLGAGLYIAKTDDQEAIAELREAVRLGSHVDEQARYFLASTLVRARRHEEAVDLIEPLARRIPDHVGYQELLARAHWGMGRDEEGVAACREAIRLAPESATYREWLGTALRRMGKLPEAIAAYREAIRLDPEVPKVRAYLGNALRESGQIEESVAVLREETTRHPEDAGPHCDLGLSLADLGDQAGAFAEFREAIRLKPDFPLFRRNFSDVLRQAGHFDEAIVQAREAIRLEPDDPVGHRVLGLAFLEQGRVDEAIAALREDVRLGPNAAVAHRTLADALWSAGRLEEALAEVRRAIEMTPKRPQLEQELREEMAPKLEHQLRLAPRLDAVVRGAEAPADNAERLEFAVLCHDTSLFAAAVRLWSEAMEADPALADDRESVVRFHAACAAVRAGAGLGREAPPLDDAARRRLRDQALAWLEAELALWTALVADQAHESKAAADSLRDWRDDLSLASVRNEGPLAGLDTSERLAWETFWRKVADQLAALEGP